MVRSSETPRLRALWALLPRAGFFAAALFVATLAFRQVESEDLGYHLAYGEIFLETGRVVDSDPFVYTLEEYAPGAARPDPGPGSWWDGRGRYRFANANWLSQALMAFVHRHGGMAALGWLQFVATSCTAALLALAMRLHGVPTLAAGFGLALFGLCAHERLNLRPESFSYLVLAAQLCLLLGRAGGTGVLRPPRIAALVVLQVLLVNSHSYFLLGLLMTAAFVVQQIEPNLGFGARAATGGGPSAPAWAGPRPWLLLLALQICASFLSHAPWRLFRLPLETLAYLRTHRISGGGVGTAVHPWSRITEFYGPFAQLTLGYSWFHLALVILLLLAAAAALSALLSKRAGRAMLLAGMGAVALSMRRNVAPAAVILVPLSFVELSQRLRPLRSGPLRSAAGAVRAALSALLILVGSSLAYRVATDDFYYRQDLPTRFGGGGNHAKLLTGPVAWINRHQPEGRVWTAFNISSNLHYFTVPPRDVPIITNTWAYPPELMADILDVSEGRAAFEPWRRRYGVQTAALDVDPATLPLVRHLARSPDWAPVFLAGKQVIFLYRRGSQRNRELAERYAIGRESFASAASSPAFVQSLLAIDPVLPAVMYDTAVALHYGFGWRDEAAALFARVTQLDPDHYRAWTGIGLSHLERAAAAPHLAQSEREQARACFERALALKPGFPPAKRALESLAKNPAAGAGG